MLASERRDQILIEAERTGFVKIADLVRTHQVSDVTIRRDLAALMQKGLVDKVHGGARARTTSDPNRVGSGVIVGHESARPTMPATRRTQPSRVLQVGVLLPSGADYFRRIIDGIHVALTSCDAVLTMSVSQYHAGREQTLVDGLIERGAHGLLLVPSLGDENDDRWLDDLPVPAVLIERELDRVALGGPSSVRTAHERGAAQAVRMLHELGHWRIALVTRGDSQVASMVRKGWQAATAELRLPDDVPVICGKDVGSWPRWEEGDVGRVVDQLRESGVTALLCHNDENALAIMDRARGIGWPVPQSLSIVAYEDEIARLATPALTAVSPPKDEVGRVAAAMLLEMIRKPGQAPRHLSIEPALVMRETTAPPGDTPKADHGRTPAPVVSSRSGRPNPRRRDGSPRRASRKGAPHGQ